MRRLALMTTSSPSGRNRTCPPATPLNVLGHVAESPQMFPAWDVPKIEVVVSGGRHQGLRVGAEIEAVHGGSRGLEPCHLFHAELADCGHGLATELDDIPTRRRHVHKSGETGEGFLSPAKLMSGPQSFDLAEKGAVGLGLGGRVRCLSRVAGQVGVQSAASRLPGRARSARLAKRRAAKSDPTVTKISTPARTPPSAAMKGLRRAHRQHRSAGLTSRARIASPFR